jgi:hypothetical protein
MDLSSKLQIAHWQHIHKLYNAKKIVSKLAFLLLVETYGEVCHLLGRIRG